MPMKHIFFTTWLLGIGLLATAPDLAGQVPASDSTAEAARDTQPAVGDSGVARDSTLNDSTRRASDTLASKAPGTAKSSGARATPPVPTDSVLSAACGSAGGPTAIARNLLVVIFAPEAKAADRAAVAKVVDGKLIGSVGPAEPGAYYVRVPSGGEEFRLRAAADKLIQLDLVRQVGSRACLPPPPVDTARQKAS